MVAENMVQYEALNAAVLSRVPDIAINILDVGCGTGSLGKELKARRSGRAVFGITYSETEYSIASKKLDKVWIADINYDRPEIGLAFDCIIFSHILEHTYHPEKVLKHFLPMLTANGRIIIALPNVLQYKQRLELMKGRFRYAEDGGLMDATHFRFFDWKTAQEMVKNAGLTIIEKEASGNFPLPLIRKLLPSFCKNIDRISLRKWPGLFAYQFVFVAKP